MTLQRHTGTHIALPPLPPIAEAPLAPDADKTVEQKDDAKSGDHSKAKPRHPEASDSEGGTQD
jgi:hypothetical protein